MNYNSMSHEDLLNAFVKDTENSEIRGEIISRMEHNENGYDSDGQAQEELDTQDLSIEIIKVETQEKISIEVEQLDLQATLYHEHNRETQIVIYFNEKLLDDLNEGDKIIAKGKFVSELDDSEIGDFTIEIEKTKNSYSINCDSESFYYELA